MRALLDTSVVVRYLTADEPALAERAAAILDHEEGLGVSDVVIAEVAYVLTSVYGVPRDMVVDNLIALLLKENLQICGLRKDRVIEALLSCRPSGRVSFADALIWAAARELRVPRIYTFDGRFPAQGVELSD